MARNGKKKTQKQKSLPFIEPDAAGIDIGATEIYVAVAEERDIRPVRKFATFTEDLHRLADWLMACSIKTVAMESTGVYWIALFQILERRGLEVCLVNARHVKGVPGRKTDIQDCQWLQYLHSVGLLRGSFRPAQAVCAVRSILRHRDNQLKSASRQVLLMQKALTQMNLQLHNVISDITGVSGLAIIDASLWGNASPPNSPACAMGASKPAARSWPKVWWVITAPSISSACNRPWKATGIFKTRLPLATSTSSKCSRASIPKSNAQRLPPLNTKLKAISPPSMFPPRCTESSE